MSWRLPAIWRTKATLFLNHADAWQVALTIAALALLIHDAVSLATLGLMAALGGGYWLAFALNDYFDAPFDALDGDKARRNYFVTTAVSPRRVRAIFTVLIIALGLAFLPFGRMGLLVFAVACLAMWSYSAPPLRLKNRPGFDLLMHALFVQTFPYVAVVLLVGGSWTRLDGVMVALLALASLAAQLEQQIRDFDVDRVNGRTFATWAGRRKTAVLLRLVTVTLIGVALTFVVDGTIPWYLLPFGLIGLPALLHRFFRHGVAPRSERLVYVSTTVGLLYGGVIFCYFLLR